LFHSKKFKIFPIPFRRFLAFFAISSFLSAGALCEGGWTHQTGHTPDDCWWKIGVFCGERITASQKLLFYHLPRADYSLLLDFQIVIWLSSRAM